ncbi:hypothetical protein OPQ81_003237 [Rhizoctonia solani]|nr:hypothetical protein OPQ81_003237 [Rhizoctonia solani]
MPLDIRILTIAPQISQDDTRLKKLETYAEQAYKIFQFIIEHGPWTCHAEDEDLFFDAYDGDTIPEPLFSKLPPQLRSVRVEGVMNAHLFNDISRPQLVGLTSIYISFAGFHPTVDQIYSMLAANPCLAKLCFNSGDTGTQEFDITAITTLAHPRIILSDLVSLTFAHITNPVWNLCVLKLFQAPALQTLELSFWFDPHTSQLLVDYIANQCKKSSPCFPSTLRELSFFTGMVDYPDPEPLLCAYPNITTLKTGSFAGLLKRPWLVPNLANLDVATRDASEVKDLIFGRCGDGLPLKKVHVRWCGDHDTLPLTNDEESEIGKLVNLTIWARSSSADLGGETNKSEDHEE